MWCLKNEFDKSVIMYNKYFGLKNEEVKDFIDLKKKIIKQLKKKSKTELENLKIQLTFETEKNGQSWDNYVSSRLTNIAIMAAVIIAIMQSHPDYTNNAPIYLFGLLVLSCLFLYTFSYMDEKKEDKKVFLKFVLSCLNNIIDDEVNNIHKNKR